MESGVFFCGLAVKEQILYDLCQEAASMHLPDAGSLVYEKAVDHTPCMNDIPQVETLDDKALANITGKMIDTFEPIEDTHLQ